VTDERALRGGLKEVTLPSGRRFRGVLPSIGGLARAGALPSNLVNVAASFGPDLFTKAARDPELAARWTELVRLLIVRFAREECQDGEWKRADLKPADLDPYEGTVDDADVDFLESIVLRARTPEEVNALFGDDPGPTVAEEAGTEALETFRGERRSPARRANSPSVGGDAKPPAGNTRRRRSVGTGRGTGVAAGGR
jgi:hypothetical protein